MIGFVGLSHLGIISSIATAAKGFEVLAYDPDVELCASLTQGTLPVFEPDLEELLTTHRAQVRFVADKAALRACDVVFFSLDIPTDAANRSDLVPLRQLIGEVVRYVSRECIIVILSQVPPGFTRATGADLATRRDCRGLFYQVETLIFGRAVERALQPERFIVGCENPELPLPDAYRQVLEAFGCPILPIRYESAELAKISINVCLVASISAANTLAELCEAINADWTEILPALRLDRRIGQYAYLSPGLGISGGNLERDLTTVKRLANEHGTDAGVIDAWLTNSRHRRNWVLEIVHREAIDPYPDPVIAIWGLTYKPDTVSLKNSPALSLIDALRPFSVRARDPKVEADRCVYPHVISCDSALDACVGAQLLVIMTPWDEFRQVPPRLVADVLVGDVVIDPFGVMDLTACAAAGLRCYQLGCPSPSRNVQ